MRTYVVTLATCFILALATCAQARSLSAQRDKDKDVDAAHAKKAAKVKIIHGPVVEGGAKPTYATIAWSTNVKASTILKYGTSPNNLTQTAEARWGGVTHRVQLSHLKPGTTYYYRVESTQAQGTGSQVLSPVDHFTTPATAAAKPAKVSPKAAAVKVTHGPVLEAETPTTATIAWSTNVSASTILKYGTNPGALTQTAEARWGGLTHRVYLRDLKPATLYYYRVESTQAQGTGTQAVSPVKQFRTRGSAVAAAHPAAAPKAAPPAGARPAAAPKTAQATALHNLHQFLATHPNINRDLQKDPYLARNGRYLAQHPAFRGFLQTHPVVNQHLAQAPKPFLQSAEVAR